MSYEDQLRRWTWIQVNLNAGAHLTYQALMSKFEIAKSTAKLDFKHFSDQGLIRFNRSEGHFEVIDKLRPLPNLFISQNEWIALLLAEQVLTQQSSAISGQLLKLINRYKENMAPFASAESIKKSVSSCLTNLEYLDANTFQHCLYALFQGDVLRFDYHKPFDNLKGKRTVSPQHLVCHDGKWIMVSWDHDAKALRNFMPSRITHIKTETTTDFHPVIRSEIDLHLNSSYGIFKGRQVDTAVLLFSEQLSVWADKQFWHVSAEKIWKDTRLELHLPIASETGILQDILKFGSNVEVLSPSSLRKNIMNEIKKIQKYYQ